MTYVLGIDIGGSGIKGAPVALATGDFAAERVRIPTPAASTPSNVADVVAEIVAGFADHFKIGVRVDQRSQSLADYDVVIRQQDCDHQILLRFLFVEPATRPPIKFPIRGPSQL